MKKFIVAGITVLLLAASCVNHTSKEEQETPVKNDTTSAGRDSLLDAVNKSLLDTVKK